MDNTPYTSGEKYYFIDGYTEEEFDSLCEFEFYILILKFANGYMD